MYKKRYIKKCKIPVLKSIYNLKISYKNVHLIKNFLDRYTHAA